MVGFARPKPLARQGFCEAFSAGLVWQAFYWFILTIKYNKSCMGLSIGQKWSIFAGFVELKLLRIEHDFPDFVVAGDEISGLANKGEAFNNG